MTRTAVSLIALLGLTDCGMGGPSLQQQALNAGVSPAAVEQCNYEAASATSGPYRGIGIEQAADYNRLLKLCLRASYAREAPANIQSRADVERDRLMRAGVTPAMARHCLAAVPQGQGNVKENLLQCAREQVASSGKPVTF